MYSVRNIVRNPSQEVEENLPISEEHTQSTKHLDTAHELQLLVDKTKMLMLKNLFSPVSSEPTSILRRKNFKILYAVTGIKISS